MVSLSTIINAFWLIAPAYASNAFPPLLKGTHPIDFRKHLFGNRLLGDGKTVEGTIGGILFGLLIGLLLLLFQRDVAMLLSKYHIVLFHHNLITISILSTCAIAGDMIGSFIKRRLSIPRGKSVPLLDQWDFLIFSLFILSFYNPVSSEIVIFLLIVTPILHLLANLIAHLFKIKQVPW